MRNEDLEQDTSTYLPVHHHNLRDQELPHLVLEGVQSQSEGSPAPVQTYVFQKEDGGWCRVC